ncbi:MAG TPA: SUF system NifU family Fe-S cluster assembly protein [Longimicrobiales bacterium]|nr:SUF system NifU family Fe-S cluster assembly protein [Longimicrobiales bacterium]
MQQPQLSSLYQQLILEHYRHPHNKAELPERTVEIHMANPVCGDEIRLQLRIEDDRIAAARFQGHGCSISQASVSMMTSLLEGRALTEADALADRFTRMMHGDEEAARDRSLGDLRALQGVSKFPVRIKCALLGFDALRQALKQSGHEGGGAGAADPSESGGSGNGASH